MLNARSKEDDLVKQHMPQVRAIAGNFRRKFPHSELDDLIGYGLVGLLKAIRGFDESRGVMLKTYAEYRIRGEILDALRNMQPLSRNEYAKKKMQLSDEECAVPIPAYAVPVQQTFNNQLGDERTIQRAQGEYVRKESQYLLLDAISRLPRCDRELIRMRYEYGWTWQMITERMNVTSWKAMQLHNAALERLRRLFSCGPGMAAAGMPNIIPRLEGWRG